MTRTRGTAAPEPPPAVIDLDHNAGTRVDPRVLDRFLAVEAACPANPGSPHAGGRRSRAVLEEARAEVAVALEVPADAVVFVGSGTEANNLVVAGAGALDRPVLLAEVEHKSILEPGRRRGIVRWAVDGSGVAIVAQPAEPVGLVCLSHAQGEVGSIQPVAAAAAVADAAGAPLHVDAAQTLGRLDVREVVRCANSIAFSAHKAGGLRGASVLVVRGEPPRPMLVGGGQERGLRPGTVSPSLAAATALAVRLAIEEWPSRGTAMRAARDAFRDALLAAVDAELLTPSTALPNTATFAFDRLDGRMLLPALDLAGVLCSQGSACSSGSPEPPAVLLAMGRDGDAARRCVRFATSIHTTIDDAREAARRVAAVVTRLRGLVQH